MKIKKLALKNFLFAVLLISAKNCFAQIELITIDQDLTSYDSLCIQPTNISVLIGQKLFILPITDSDEKGYSRFYTHLPQTESEWADIDDESKINYSSAKKLSGKEVTMIDFVKDDRDKGFTSFFGPRFMKLYLAETKDTLYFDNSLIGGIISMNSYPWYFVPQGTVNKINQIYKDKTYIVLRNNSLKDYETKSSIYLQKGDEVVFDKVIILNSKTSYSTIAQVGASFRNNAGQKFFFPLGCLSDTFCLDCLVNDFDHLLFDKSLIEKYNLSDSDWKNIMNGEVKMGMALYALAIVKNNFRYEITDINWKGKASKSVFFSGDFDNGYIFNLDLKLIDMH